MENADRRAQPRLPAEQTVQVTALAPGEISLIGRVVQVSGKGMRFLLDAPIESGTVVQVDFGDAQLSGEVRYCHPEDGNFAVGLQLERPTASLPNLIRILR